MTSVHLITAHPRNDSFNYAMRNVARDELTSRHSIVTTDVYDLYQNKHPAVMPYGLSRPATEQALIHKEQEKIKKSDLTILQFPLYWFSMPGILKNYWDQVLEPGFAYPGKFTNSPLNDGRKILFSITTQSTQSDYSEGGCNGDLLTILHPLTVAFRFVGFTILKPFIVYNVHAAEPDYLGKELQRYQAYLQNLNNTTDVWKSV